MSGLERAHSLREIVDALPEEPRVVVSGNFATPFTVLREIDALLPSYRLWALNGQPGLPDREGVVLETSFVGPGMRRSPRLRYVPARLSTVPALFRRNMAPDLVVLHTSLPVGGPGDGQVSLGTEVNVLPAAVEAVRRRGGRVVAQANRQMPFTYGDGVLPLADLDLVVEVDEPLGTHGRLEPDEDSRAIGEAVAARVRDGATLQAGIGGIPDAALLGLTDRRGLRVWTEMFSDSVLALERAGALDPEVPLTTSFVFGSQELYDWLDRNERVHMTRTEVTNDPSRIAANPRMVSINSALEVDLYAQANASRVHSRIYSGIGGQTDFIVGAIHSEDGQAMIGLRSWHPKADISTIVPLISEPVTSFQMSAVVTEQGTAEILGHDQERQASNLITHAAHPSVRDELWEEAERLGLA
ncbi:MAG TPA: acetyl-CoA hydrolase/transferase C-terminal domain-containing protein [Marmoricola sp.]|nr:acetyl-CoA hydrolase/transferase C-terminal domain-containing protein [Marmoricola sp.]